MNKFKLFIEQANFKDETLKTVKLNKVYVSSINKGWTFDLEFLNQSTPKNIDHFIDSLKLYFQIPNLVKKVNYEISLTNKDSWHDKALDYFNWLLSKLIDEKSSFLVYQNYKVEFNDGEYTIYVDERTKRSSQIKKRLIPMFEKYGMDATIKLVVDEELLTNNDILQKKKSKAMTEIPVNVKPIPKREKQQVVSKVYRGKQRNLKVEPIRNIPKTNHELAKYLNTENDEYFCVEGVIIEVEVRKLKRSHLLQMTISSDDDAIVVKQFLNRPAQVEEASKFQDNYLVEVTGKAQYDAFMKEVVIMADSINEIEKVSRKRRTDTAKEKRIEFHLHTKLSNLDAVGDVKEYINQAIGWGHKAIAFTDHDGLYAYPEIDKYTLNKDIKPIYGVELEYVDEDDFKLAFDDSDIDLRKATYVVFDFETTGLSYTRDKIIEISAVKVENLMITSQFSMFVNPEEKLSQFISDFTSITDEDLQDAQTIDEVLPQFIDFIGDSILVAHNAKFDLGHLYYKMKELGLGERRYPAIDTMNIAKYFYSDKIKRFNLRNVARLFKVKLEQHHRAEFDARATGEIFINMLTDLYKKDVKIHSDLNKLIDLDEVYKHAITNHVVVLAKNQVGYKNLFKLISEALTDTLVGNPRLTKKTLNKYKEGLLVGSACYKGRVFESALYETEEELIKAMEMFDYIEVQPPQAYKHLYDEFDDGELIIEHVIRKIIFIAKDLNKLVIATGDVHYLNKEDSVYRDVYINATPVGGGLHDLKKYKKKPDVYFLTTDEMLEQFSFLDRELAYEIVVTNTNYLNNQIDKVEAFPKTLYSLSDDIFKDKLGVESIKETVEEIVYDNARKWYGKDLHPIVEARIKKELDVIIKNEYAPIYYISYLLVQKSVEDGYMVGSRGSVGSSFVATLMEVTEVNPLKPHYRCKNSCFTVFEHDEKEMNGYELNINEKTFQPFFKGAFSGYDLPNKECPICGEKLVKDGQDIPFETFLGFSGDKIPDIDLNFSGEYQTEAHNYVRELIGEDHAYRAGTINTVAEKTAFGYVKGYLEDNNIIGVRDARVKALAKKVQGVKRSTGQHPGGIVVVPDHKDIFDVTPIQFPANDKNSEWKTTHFDYDSFEANLLKLDILGHDNPTVIKYLMDYVKENPDEFPFDNIDDIPIDDEKVYGLFGGVDSIGLKEEDLGSKVASFGVPELGTPFVRQMLENTQPNTFAGLVKISGLSHGNDVWAGNAREIINGETEYKNVTFDDIIGCRDDIMVDLMNYGMSPSKSFEIMEFVRRGHPSKFKEKWEEYKIEMKRNNVPDWYIYSASLIKYMFPKAHAAAYVLMAVRIAWFKVHHPKIFYSTFFSIRANHFEHETMVSGAIAIRNRIKDITEKSGFYPSALEAALLVNLQVALEMYLRGIKFLRVDINKSAATTFILEEEGLRMPFITIDGLGLQVAHDVVKTREEEAFKSVEDVKKRTRLNKTVCETLEKIGAFDDLDDETDIFGQGLFAL